MKRIKKEVKEGTAFFKVSYHDAIEILLFVILLAAILGAIFREKFVYVIFAAIVIFVWWELRKYRKEKKVMDMKLDRRIEEFELKKALREKAHKNKKRA